MCTENNKFSYLFPVYSERVEKFYKSCHCYYVRMSLHDSFISCWLWIVINNPNFLAPPPQKHRRRKKNQAHKSHLLLFASLHMMLCSNNKDFFQFVPTSPPLFLASHNFLETISQPASRLPPACSKPGKNVQPSCSFNGFIYCQLCNI